MKKILLAIAVVVITGCSSAPPTIQQGPNAEITFDGLHAVDNSVFKLAWADPDIDFSKYNQFIAGNTFLEFRAVRKISSTQAMSTSREFYIDEKNREQLREEVSTIFQNELAKSTRFTMVEAPGPNVLVIGGGLLDIVSNVPPEPVGRANIYISSVGEITLLLEIADSMSGEVIFRAAERRIAERDSGQAMLSNSVSNWAEIRRLLRRWAITLREGLDAIPEA